MKLHGRAELSLNARRRLASRVVERGWTLGEAAAAAEVSVRTAGKWAGRSSSRVMAACLIGPQHPGGEQKNTKVTLHVTLKNKRSTSRALTLKR